MLTPVDIQQKKFKSGLGYDKKDVGAFFDEVSKSYGELYRSNAELKEKVITLTDTVQHYKVKEEDLNKSLMRAEKNSQESLSNAVKNAKSIEMEANAHAAEIIRSAKSEKERLEGEIIELTRRYVEYKNMFIKLVNQHLTYLETHDFDKDADTYIDKKAPDTSIDDFFDMMSGPADPQPKTQSQSGPSKLSIKGTQSNSSNVYGSTLGGDGINPFGD